MGNEKGVGIKLYKKKQFKGLVGWFSVKRIRSWCKRFGRYIRYFKVVCNLVLGEQKIIVWIFRIFVFKCMYDFQIYVYIFLNSKNISLKIKCYNFFNLGFRDVNKDRYFLCGGKGIFMQIFDRF